LKGIKHLILSFYLIAPAILQSQYQVVKYSVRDGLTHNHVYQTFQDSRGFLWSVTLNSLEFFDGTDFTTVAEWPPLSSSKEVMILFEDAGGKLWIRRRDQGGVFFEQVDIKTRKSNRLHFLKGDIPLSIHTVALSTDGTVLLGDDQGILWKRGTDGKVEEYYRCGLGRFEFCTYKSEENTIWIQLDRYQQGGSLLLSIDEYKKVMEYFVPDLDYEMLPAVGGGLWVICANQYAHIKEGQKPVFHSSKAIDKVKGTRIRKEIFALEPGRNQIWIFNEGVPMLLDAERDKVLSEIQLPVGSRIEGAFHILIDRQHRFWVSTLHGLFKVERLSSRFVKIAAMENGSIFLRPSRGIIEDSNGLLYCNIGDSTYRFDPSSGKLSLVTSQKLGYYGISQDEDGSLLLGLSEFRKLDLKTGTYRNYASSALYGNIWSILPTKSCIWLGHSNGLLYFDRATESIEAFQQYNGHDALRRSEVYLMLSSEAQNSIYLFTSTGIYHLDPKRGILARYWSGGSGKYFLPADNVRHACPDGAGGYWLATSEGLLHWNWMLAETHLYTVKDGLPNSNIYAVYLDEFGYLWCTSDLGITQLQPSTGKLRFFTISDGLPHNEFNRLAHLRASDGHFYFGGLNGVVQFHPKDFKDDFEENTDAQLFLTSATFPTFQSAASGDVLTDFYETGELKLAPGIQVLYLKFSIPPSQGVEHTTYYYRIKGIYEQYLSSKTGEIQLWGLAPGEYFLELFAKTANGRIIQSAAPFRMIILPPFYKSSWFRFSVLLLLLTGLSLLWMRRIKVIQKRQVELKEEVAKRTAKILEDKKLIVQQAARLRQQDREKTRFITNLMHELRTPLSLIQGPLERYRKMPGHRVQEDHLLQIATNNANRMLELVNDALLLQTIAEGGVVVQQEATNLDRFVRGVASEFMILAKKKGLYLQVESAITKDLQVFCDVKSLRGILNNLLSNALKFTSSGGITIRLTEFEQHIQFSVTDSGRGIHPDDLPHVFERYYQTQRPDAPLEGGAGIGLALCREWAQLLEGSIWVESTWQKGSSFFLEIPKKIVEQPVEIIDHLRSTFGEHGDPTVPKVLDGKKASILLVEDHAEFQEYLEVLLRPFYRVMAVSNGEEALDWLSSHPLPDLILTDVMMPEHDGFQLIEALKSKEEYDSIPVVVITAKSGEEDRKNALQLGADDYLEKPFTETALIASLQTLLSKKKDQQVSSSEVSLKDLEWLQKLEDLVFAHLGDNGFSVDWCAAQMLMARSAFFKEVKRLTGMTPNQYIQEARLEKGRRLLESGAYDSIKKLVVDLGVQDERYFSKLFKQRYGRSIRSLMEA
jgi:signal transduction histidine kinase/ligand-binding sensor domain-containing protein/FixJ family two-component response regulator